jgi:hypothetical protein
MREESDFVFSREPTSPHSDDLRLIRVELIRIDQLSITAQRRPQRNVRVADDVSPVAEIATASRQ